MILTIDVRHIWNRIYNAQQSNKPIQTWSEPDPTMTPPWPNHELVISHPPVRRAYLSRFGDAFLHWKLKHVVLRVSTQISPNTAPATKSDTPTSPNTAPATKSNTPTSPNAPPATTRDTPSSPNSTPSTKSETVTEQLQIWADTKLLLSCYQAVTKLLLNCYWTVTELILDCHWTFFFSLSVVFFTRSVGALESSVWWFSILCPETANPGLKAQKKKGVPVLLANERCVEMRNDTLVQEYCWCPASGRRYLAPEGRDNSRKDSATRTRARVARVRAEYPNQLDYSGFCAGHAAAFKKILACSTRRWGLRHCHGLLAAMRHGSLGWEYPNQLDYSGFCAGHAAAFKKILACSTRRWGLRPLTSHIK